MYGMIFLALIGAGLGWMVYTEHPAWTSLVGTLSGWGIEPVFQISYFTDWITWCLSDTYGLIMLGGMAFIVLVIIMNIAAGDASR